MIPFLRDITGWAKFRCGECHVSEYCTRIIVLGRNAFLIGNAIFSRVDKILTGPYDSYYGEYSEGNCQKSSFGVSQASVYMRRNALGNIGATTATAATIIMRFFYFAVEYDGVNHLYNCYLIGRF